MRDTPSVFEVFEEGLGLSEEAQRAILEAYFPGDEKKHAEIEALWSADGDSSFEPVAEEAMAILFEDRPPPNTFADFELIEEIGRGGMGRVYLARQLSLDRDVAVKTLPRAWADALSLDRFKREIRHIAAMSHRNIATVHGMDTLEDGRPFFYMEYLEGQRLDHWAEGKPTEEILRLFCDICEGVSHAHMKGVVHRDLKPSNILVVGDTPKIIDFGIASTVEDSGQCSGTRGYVAPEVLEGAIADTRSDIYALGVMLKDIYGEQPGKVGISAKGDLPKIIEKASAIDPNERYNSSEALRDDLKAYLEGCPVSAASGSLFYVTGKWIKRHQWKLVLLLVISSVASFTAIERWQITQRIELVRSELQHTDSFIHFLFSSIDPEQKGQDVKVIDLLDGAAMGLEKSGIKAYSKATFSRTLGSSYLNLGHYDQGKNLMEYSLKYWKEQFGHDDKIVLELQLRIAYADFLQARYKEAEKKYRQVQILANRAGLDKEYNIAKGALADILTQKGKFSEAELTYQEVLSALEVSKDENINEWLSVMERLGILYRRAGKLKESEKWLRKTIQEWRLRGSVDSPQALNCRQHLMITIFEMGQVDIPEQNQIWKIRKRLMGPSHLQTLESQNSLANMKVRTGETQEAMKLLREGIAMGSTAPVVLRMANNLANYLMSSDPREAETLLRKTLKDSRSLLGPDDHDTLVTACTLGEALQAQGRLEEARVIFEETYKTASKKLGETSKDALLYQGMLAICMLEQGEKEEAKILLKNSHEGLKAAGSMYASMMKNALDRANQN